MTSGRRTAWAITLAAAAAFIAAIIPLTQRVGEFNRNKHFLNLHADPVYDRSFQVPGGGAATLNDAPAESLAPGRFAVRLDYGGRTIDIPVKTPPARDLPGLAAYDEWLKVLRLFAVERSPAGEPAHKPGSDQMLIVVRRTPEGFDPESWGAVRRIEWVFDYYRLKPDGTVEQFSRRWPRSGMSESRLQREARGEDAPDSKPDPRSAALAAIEPLNERTPEYFAALHVIPKLNVPRYKFNDTAFSPHVLGWTLPVSMLSVLAFCGGLIFAMAPRRAAPAPV